MITIKQVFNICDISAYLPYKLWQIIFVDEKKSLFEFETKTLIKFILVIFTTIFSTTLFVGITFTENEILQFFKDSNLQFNSHIEYIGIRFINDFDITVFFGMPIFFILICYEYNFYIPSSINKIQPIEKASQMDRLAVTFLYGFFVVLFIVLDISGAIHDLDKMDT